MPVIGGRPPLQVMLVYYGQQTLIQMDVSLATVLSDRFHLPLCKKKK